MLEKAKPVLEKGAFAILGRKKPQPHLPFFKKLARETSFIFTWPKIQGPWEFGDL